MTLIAPPLPANFPANEAERLADLHALELLDTPAEERFDRIVRLAMAIFDVPIAYLALIDADRQWFKAKCGHTILQADDRPDAIVGRVMAHAAGPLADDFALLEVSFA
jgi:hypothetical protein